MQLETTVALLTDERVNVFWSRKERRKWFLSLLCGTCLVYATRTSVPLLMPVISREKQWSKTESGTILSSFFWGYTLTQVASGYVSDQIGGQKVIWFSALGWSITTFFMPEIIQFLSRDDSSVQLVAIVRIMNGAFQGILKVYIVVVEERIVIRCAITGMHFPSMISLTSQHLHEADRASFFSLLTSGSALGTLLTSSLGSYLLKNYNWATVFQVLGGLGLAWTIILGYHSLSLKGRSACNKPSSTNNTLPWLQLLLKPPFWSCVIGHACQNNCFFVLLSWMPMYFHDTFPEVKGWVANVVPWLSLLPCTFIGRVLSEKLVKAGYSITATRKTIETICFVTQSVNLLFLARVETFQSAILCLALIIGGSGFHNNAIAVNPSDLAPKHSGSVFGLMNTVGAIPGFLGVYFAGYILHVTYSWPAVFITISVIDVLGCIIYLLFGSGNAII